MLYGCWIVRGVTCIESTCAVGCTCHQQRGTVWTLAPLPVGLCPGAPALHGDKVVMGRGGHLSPTCLWCLHAQLCGVSVPYPLWVLEASLQGRERRAAAWLCSTILSSITGTGREFLMNSAFHLLLVVLFLHFRVPDAPSECNEGGASLVLWEVEMLRCSYLWTELWARPCR